MACWLSVALNSRSYSNGGDGPGHIRLKPMISPARTRMLISGTRLTIGVVVISVRQGIRTLLVTSAPEPSSRTADRWIDLGASILEIDRASPVWPTAPHQHPVANPPFVDPVCGMTVDPARASDGTSAYRAGQDVLLLCRWRRVEKTICGRIPWLGSSNAPVAGTGGANSVSKCRRYHVAMHPQSGRSVGVVSRLRMSLRVRSRHVGLAPER